MGKLLVKRSLIQPCTITSLEARDFTNLWPADMLRSRCPCCERLKLSSLVVVKEMELHSGFLHFLLFQRRQYVFDYPTPVFRFI